MPTPVPEALGGGATPATCARAGIPDHLDRSPLNSIRTAANSGPLTAAWHARPLVAPAELSNKSGIDALLQGPEVTAVRT